MEKNVRWEEKLYVLTTLTSKTWSLNYLQQKHLAVHLGFLLINSMVHQPDNIKQPQPALKFFYALKLELNIRNTAKANLFVCMLDLHVDPGLPCCFSHPFIVVQSL